MIKKIALTSVGLLLLLAGILTFGPREPIDETITFKEASLGKDLDLYLADRENTIANLNPGAEKQIIWRDPRSKQPHLCKPYRPQFAGHQHKLKAEVQDSIET